MTALRPLAKCTPRLEPDAAQEAQELLGALSERISALRILRDRGGDSGAEASIDLSSLVQELQSLNADYTDLLDWTGDDVSNDNGEG